MFKGLFFRPKAAPDTSGVAISHPADALLESGLRLLPTPAPGADFDRNVLAALSASPTASRRRRMIPSWGVPAAAATCLALTLLVPATRAVVRTELVSVNRYLGLGGEVLFPPPALPALPPDRQWITVLPPLLSYDDAARQYVLSRIGKEGFYQYSYDRREADALLSVQAKWQHQPAFVAALLRHRLARTTFPGRAEAASHLGLWGVSSGPHYSRVWYAPPTPEAVARLATQAQASEPDNAFFTAASAAVAFEKGRDEEAIRLVKALPKTSRWDDYRTEELLTRYQWEKWREDLPVTSARRALGYNDFETFPSNLVSAVAVRATAYAVSRERAGQTGEGMVVRLALFDLARKICLSSQDYGDWFYANQIMMTAMEGTPGADTETRFSASQLTVDVAARKKHIAARPRRFQAFLRAQGAGVQADWVARVLQAQQAKSLIANPAVDDLHKRLAEERKPILSIARLNPLARNESRLRAGWAGIDLGALSPLIAWGIAALVGLIWRLPTLRRKEEFPVWWALGASLGFLVETGIHAMEGIWGIGDLYQFAWVPIFDTNQFVLMPVLTVLVLGIGYLRLHRARLIGLSALAAVFGVFCASVIIRVGHALVMRAASVWTEESYLVLQGHWWPYDHQLGIYAPLAVIFVTMLVGLAFWRKRRSTWQVACQRVSHQSLRLGWVLMIALCFWCADIAHQESAFEQIYVQDQVGLRDSIAWQEPITIPPMPALSNHAGN